MSKRLLLLQLHKESKAGCIGGVLRLRSRRKVATERLMEFYVK
jgi:hypothetical protein